MDKAEYRSEELVGIFRECSTYHFGTAIIASDNRQNQGRLQKSVSNHRGGYVNSHRISTNWRKSLSCILYKESKKYKQIEAAGLRHLAFEVDNLAEAVGELDSKGVKHEPIRTDEYTGKQFVFFSDPDDLPIELYEK